MDDSKKRIYIVITCIAIMLASAITAADTPKTNVSKNIQTQNGELIFTSQSIDSGFSVLGSSPGSITKNLKKKAQTNEKRVALGDRYLLGTSKFHTNEFIALGKPNPAGGMTVEVLNITGAKVAQLNLSRFNSPILLEKSIVVVTSSLHAVGSPHELTFYSWQGDQLSKVNVSNLMLMSSYPQLGGELATINKDNSKNETVIRIYNSIGIQIWNYIWPGDSYPEVKITPDNSRIIIISQTGQNSNVIILDNSNVLVAKHSFDGMSGLRISNDSQHLAVSSKSGLFLINLSSGKPVWKAPGRFYAIHDGLQFDKKTGGLNVIHVEDSTPNEYSLHLHQFDLKDGTAKQADLGIIPKADPYFHVVDISEDSQGIKRITFGREFRTINPNSWIEPTP